MRHSNSDVKFQEFLICNCWWILRWFSSTHTKEWFECKIIWPTAAEAQLFHSTDIICTERIVTDEWMVEWLCALADLNHHVSHLMWSSYCVRQGNTIAVHTELYLYIFIFTPQIELTEKYINKSEEKKEKNIWYD